MTTPQAKNASARLVDFSYQYNISFYTTSTSVVILECNLHLLFIPLVVELEVEGGFMNYSTIVFLGFVLACPLIHIWMMRGGGHKH